MCLLLIRCIYLVAAVIALFCRQYDIIKDNDSNNHSKEKTKPLSEHSTPDYRHGGLLGSKVKHLLGFYTIWPKLWSKEHLRCWV